MKIRYIPNEEDSDWVAIHPTHTFNAGRCIHCGTDNHSLPATEEDYAAYELPCPVAYEDRTTTWTFTREHNPLNPNNEPSPQVDEI